MSGYPDPPAFTRVNPAGRAPMLLTCDHASNAVPRHLNGLGLGPEALTRHIAWDIGAAAVAAELAPRLDAPAILSGYSRLVVDCNRSPDDPSSILAESDGTIIPGNQRLGNSERRRRVDSYFLPYHAAITRQLDEFGGRSVVPALVSVHSFTPVMRGESRPWHVGILWDEDPRIAMPLMGALGREAELVVGDNQPYSAREPAGYSMVTHAEPRALPHVAIEIRQDLIACADGARSWAERLAAALLPILAAL